MATKNQTLSVMLDGSGNIKSAHNPAMGLNDLSDVDTTGLAVDKTIKYNSSTSKWEASDLSVDTSNLISVASVDSAFSTLVGTAPAELDTLSEIATRLGDDPTFGTGWTAYQSRQKTKTWTGMTGKGPTGTLPVGPSGSVTLTNGVNGNGETVGIPVEADLKYANIEVFLNGVLMKNAYRSASDGTLQWGEFDYHPYDGVTMTAGSPTLINHPNADLIANGYPRTTVDLSSGNMQIDNEHFGDDLITFPDQAEIDALLTALGIDPSNPQIGHQIHWAPATFYEYGGPTPESERVIDSNGIYSRAWGDTSYYWTGTISGYSTNIFNNDTLAFSSIVDSNGDARSLTDWVYWLESSDGSGDLYNAQEGVTRVSFMSLGSGGGPAVWNGSGSQPTMNYIVFPNIDFVADDILTIRTF